MTVYYPPVSFYFTVDIVDLGTAGDSSFMEVQGLQAERDILEIKEGGENRFSHRLPDRAKYGNLILKRGVLLPTSGFGSWCKGVLESNFDTPISSTTILLSLLDANGNPLLSWNFIGAWPVKWSVSDLGADKSELAVESMELAYNYFIKAPGKPQQAPAN
ncbi:phage tail protein [Massilia endophytica]|uniref:phage tail protein n=1 Tax=Massilia endophytica TaxID=2899220 RepID=UPI001E2ED9DE|nr:phage tail protein [Massilia endophytica]UGQ48172.1 phage tail protein [Massilia endophytica]